MLVEGMKISFWNRVFIIVNIHSMQLQSYLNSYVGRFAQGPVSNAIFRGEVPGTPVVFYLQHDDVYVGEYAQPPPSFLYATPDQNDLVAANSAKSNYLLWETNKYASWLCIQHSETGSSLLNSVGVRYGLLLVVGKKTLSWFM